MPRTSPRGGPETRGRIAQVAAELFLERGFDVVTVADVARAAGVSSVTVYNHFPRKEDLFLDRSEEADQLIRSATTGQVEAAAVLDALHVSLRDLADSDHPLSALDPRSVAFFRTVAASPALTARARELVAELESVLRAGLGATGLSAAAAAILAAAVVSGYAAVFVRTAAARIEGADLVAARRIFDDDLALLFAGVAAAHRAMVGS